jgi:hypothetical protein
MFHSSQRIKMPVMNSSANHSESLDVLARIVAVGIFVIENVNHTLNFGFEVRNLVSPALVPLPLFVAQVVHGITVLLGITGSLLVRHTKFVI